MKKNSFMEGAIVATLGIIIVKVIGLIYVIPFNAIIGEQGGALYGYAYNIYMLFLSISSAGFPFAISKLTSEYTALGNKKAVKDTYDISLKLISIISIIIFIILFAFAPSIGKLIIGNSTGGNTYSDIECANVKLSLDNLYKLCQVFDVSADYIIFGETEDAYISEIRAIFRKQRPGMVKKIVTGLKAMFG